MNSSECSNYIFIIVLILSKVPLCIAIVFGRIWKSLFDENLIYFLSFDSTLFNEKKPNFNMLYSHTSIYFQKKVPISIEDFTLPCKQLDLMQIK